MVSKKIGNVRHQIDVLLMEGMAPTLAQMRAMRDILLAAEAGAHTLERSQVPAGMRLTSEHLASGNVALFPVVPKLHPAIRNRPA